MSEQTKYEGIYGSKSDFPSYGHSNHGRYALDLLDILKPKSLLDVGCGYNEFVHEAKKRQPHIRAVGMDFACPGADLIGDACSIPFQDKNFDLITSFDVLEHLRTEQVNIALAEMARVSCQFLLSICYCDSHYRWQGSTLHPTVQPESWWIDRLLQAGATAIETHALKARYIMGQWAA